MMINKGRAAKMMLAALATTTLVGCADYTTQQGLKAPESEMDSNEGVNRFFYAVNNAIDAVLIKPITYVYRSIVPETGREMVSNFVHNLGSPVYFGNSVLQGDVENSFAVFWRFALNTTVGVGGLFDVAESNGLRARDADFGQTMAVWGVPSGDYTFVPVFGPGTVRDTFGRLVDLAMNPSFWAKDNWYGYAQAGITILDTRSRNYTLIEDTKRTSLDPYATFRSGYMQRRTAEIRKAQAVHQKGNAAPAQKPVATKP